MHWFIYSKNNYWTPVMLDPENMNKGIASVPKDSDSEADLNFRVTWEACYKKLGFLCLIPRHSALGKNRMWTGNHTFIKNLQVILLQVAWELDFNQWPKRGQNIYRKKYSRNHLRVQVGINEQHYRTSLNRETWSQVYAEGGPYSGQSQNVKPG